jgi:hypothetical protein
MEIEITPEPAPEERAAIEQALAALARADGKSPWCEWWRRGLEEAVAWEPDGSEP